MSLPVVLRHQAAEELLAACDYVDVQRLGLSTRLVVEVERVLDRSATHPDAWHSADAFQTRHRPAVDLHHLRKHRRHHGEQVPPNYGSVFRLHAKRESAYNGVSAKPPVTTPLDTRTALYRDAFDAINQRRAVKHFDPTHRLTAAQETQLL